jgi:hypothetical protein
MARKRMTRGSVLIKEGDYLSLAPFGTNPDTTKSGLYEVKRIIRTIAEIFRKRTNTTLHVEGTWDRGRLRIQPTIQFDGELKTFLKKGKPRGFTT